MGFEFGERLLFKKRSESNHLAKMMPRWEYGVFLGVKQRSGELFVMSNTGLEIVRSARRVPVEDRWNPMCLDWVNVVPWNLGKEDKRADGDVPEQVKSGPARELSQDELENLAVSPKRSYPEFKIMKADLERFGYTHRCPGCSSRLRGVAVQPHNKVCRERFEFSCKFSALIKLFSGM